MKISLSPGYCETCVHELVHAFDPPCRTCFVAGNFPSWTPKPGVRGPKVKSPTLPTDRQARKNIPLYSGLIKYFPDALAAVAELSRIGNDQHNPGQPLNWDRSKSSDEHDALCRHLWEAGTVDTDGVRHSVKVAWRALAALQKEIEANRPSAQPCGDDK